MNMQKVKVNWEKIINKSIIMKCEAIFEALKWDLSGIISSEVKKSPKSVKSLTLRGGLRGFKGQISTILPEIVNDTPKNSENSQNLSQSIENKEVKEFVEDINQQISKSNLIPYYEE